MIRLQSFSETKHFVCPEQLEEFLRRDEELMSVKRDSHTKGVNLGFVIGFITGLCIAAALTLIVKLI